MKRKYLTYGVLFAVAVVAVAAIAVAVQSPPTPPAVAKGVVSALKANGLVVEETVLEVSARLVVNRVALKLHAERLRRLVAALRAATEG